MAEILRLYRGDSSKIKQFDFHKTNKSCYVGQGIYLTNDVRLADTYRTKGNYRYMPDNNIISGAYDTKTEAIEDGLINYVRYVWESENECRCKDIKILEKMAVGLRREYLDLIESGELKIDRQANYDRKADAPRFRFHAAIMMRGVGYVTVFDFPRSEFERDMVKICGNPRHIDEGFLELVYEHKCYEKIDYGQDFQHFKETIFKSPPMLRDLGLGLTRRRRSSEKGEEALKSRPGWDISRLKHNRLIQILKPYGFKGFEYEGGENTGGKRHRAFCVWSDEYVNEHKVACIK